MQWSLKSQGNLEENKGDFHYQITRFTKSYTNLNTMTMAKRETNIPMEQNRFVQKQTHTYTSTWYIIKALPQFSGERMIFSKTVLKQLCIHIKKKNDPDSLPHIILKKLIHGGS